VAKTFPPIFINKYLAAKISPALPEYFSNPLKFFPTMPTDIESLTETFPEAANDVFAVYDRMLKMRRKAFPHIKSEQVLYYFYKVAGDISGLLYTTQAVQDLLDRGDESAEDLNTWITSLPRNAQGNVVFDEEEFSPVHFHDIKIYQLEETRDIIDFGTARTYAGNKIIIDYTYHAKGYPQGTPVAGFDAARPRYENSTNDDYNGTQIV